MSPDKIYKKSLEQTKQKRRNDAAACTQMIKDFNARNAAGSDLINHPSHYNTGKIEVIEFIEDQKFDYHTGNAVKYICRAGKKDPCKTVEDLEKAIWYLRRKIELERYREDAIPIRRPNEMTEQPR